MISKFFKEVNNIDIIFIRMVNEGDIIGVDNIDDLKKIIIKKEGGVVITINNIMKEGEEERFNRFPIKEGGDRGGININKIFSKNIDNIIFKEEVHNKRGEYKKKYI